MSIIKLFNKALRGNTTNYKELSAFALQVGYLVHPDCSTLEVYDFLKDQKIDYNSTFYKSWRDVTSISREEIWTDQVVSYFANYRLGVQWVPNSTPSQEFEYKDFKAILPISQEEVTQRCQKMLSTNVAFSQDTILMILSACKICNYSVDIESVQNKEAKMWLYKELGLVPKDAIEMVRYLVFLATGKSLLIKDKQTVEAIKQSSLDISKEVALFGGEKISSVFLRFKPLFLAFKKSNPALINKLRRLAVINHKPCKNGYWTEILNNPESLGELPSKLPELTNFKKVALIEAINLRFAQSKLETFVIRNGKFWIQERNKKIDLLKNWQNNSDIKNMNYLKMLRDILYKSLVESLKTKATTIKLPSGIDIKLPKSEKSFIGNYPLGTTINFDKKDTIVGIHWREADGARDLDLKLIDIDGKQFGWNANFTNTENSVIYSGDVTSANPEATELFYAKNGFKPSIIKVNKYSGNDNSKFRFFIAQEKIDNLSKNYMVNPNSIAASSENNMDSTEKVLGVLLPDRFILCNLRSGNSQVAGDSITNQYVQYTLDTLDTYVSLEQLLKDAGFDIVSTEAEIDLTNLSKDTLINLIS